MNFLSLNFIIALWVTAITTFCIGIFVYWKNPKARLNRIFALYSWSISWWGFCQIWLVACDSRVTALIWARIEQVGVFFIPTLFIHFVITFLGLKNKGFLLKLYYGISIFFATLCPTRYMMADAVPKFYVKHFATPGFAYPFAVFFFFAITAYGLYELFKEYLHSSGARRNQMKYLVWSSLVGYIGGGANFLLVFDINIPFLNPFGTYSLPVYVAATTYAIIRHQLMEIEVVVKKTLIFASLFAIVFGVFMGITLLTQELIAGGRLLGLAISTIIIILSVRPLENLLIRVTDKYLFQKKYSPTQLIKTFTDEVLTLLDLNRLVRTTVTTLANTLKLQTCAIFLLNKDEDKYELQDSYGIDNDNMVISVESSFAKYLGRTGDILLFKEDMPEEIKNDMKKVNAQLAFPLILHRQMTGILCLGKKKSDEDYTKEDTDILTALAKAEAIALSNARLFSEAKQNVKLAAIGALAAGINHEVCNPLNRIMSGMQIFLKSKDMGLYKDKSNKELAEMSDNIMKDAMNDIRKIASITRKLSDFAKPSGEPTAERIDISEGLKETMGVLGHEMELKRIDFVQDIKELLFIMADRDQLQEIFFNIIRNAIQAIQEKGKIIFSAWKKDDNVIIDITDTGRGISEDRLQKIYDPFYTTKGEGKGTGLGLAIVHQLVLRNRGNISVRSRVGEGTTFTLMFPRVE